MIQSRPVRGRVTAYARAVGIYFIAGLVAREALSARRFVLVVVGVGSCFARCDLVVFKANSPPKATFSPLSTVGTALLR